MQMILLDSITVAIILFNFRHLLIYSVGFYFQKMMLNTHTSF